MDVGLMSVEQDSMGQHGVDFNRFDEINIGPDSAGISASQNKNSETDPHVGLEFAYVDAARSFYNEYAKRSGFTTVVNQNTGPTPDAAIATSASMESNHGTQISDLVTNSARNATSKRC
ncbi:hypothetical protein L1987_56509 [Smallanthus sonchifolius]|uniref:Uncharacterized protein n=1 Tax=Smallanthus sonchifolius TaxID=185202 RepID=A0ACB9EE13_9ASTR|nr:hypothetical protein L1987_56509 [Smallanthus sonchifolius]